MVRIEWDRILDILHTQLPKSVATIRQYQNITPSSIFTSALETAIVTRIVDVQHISIDELDTLFDMLFGDIKDISFDTQYIIITDYCFDKNTLPYLVNAGEMRSFVIDNEFDSFFDGDAIFMRVSELDMRMYFHEGHLFYLSTS